MGELCAYLFDSGHPAGMQNRRLTCGDADCRCSITTLHSVTRERATPGPGEWGSGGGSLSVRADRPRARTREPLPSLLLRRATRRVSVEWAGSVGTQRRVLGGPRGVVASLARRAPQAEPRAAHSGPVAPTARVCHQRRFRVRRRAEPDPRDLDLGLVRRTAPDTDSRARCHAIRLPARPIRASTTRSLMLPSSAFVAAPRRCESRQE